MALRNVLLKITGDNADAKRAISETRRDLRGLDGDKATAEMRVDGATASQARIEELRASLGRFDHTTATAEARIKVDRAYSDLDRLEGRIAKALDIKDDGRRNRVLAGLLGGAETTLARAAKVAEQVGEETSQATGLFSKLGQTAVQTGSDVASGFARMGQGLPVIGGLVAGLAEMGPVALAIVPIIGFALVGALAAAATAVVALAGAFVALIAVVGAAVGGLATIGVAIASLGGPVVILAIATLARLAKVFTALKGGSKDAESSAKGVSTALKGQRDAQQALTDATRNSTQQRVAAARDERDSILGVKDAELQRQEALLGITDATLSVKRAREALAAARKDTGTDGSSLSALFGKATDVAVDPATEGKLLGQLGGASSGSGSEESRQLKIAEAVQTLRHALLAQKEARQTVAHATNAQADAEKKADDYARDGLRAYQPYADSLRQVADAQRKVHDAQEQVSQARDKATASTKGLDSTEKGLLGTLTSLKDTLKRDLGPATDAVLGGLVKALGRLKPMADAMRAPFLRLGQAIGDGLGDLAKTLTGPSFIRGFQRATDAAARLVRSFGVPVIRDVSKLLLAIGNAAIPRVERGLRTLARRFDVFTDGALQGDKLRRVVNRLIDAFVLVGSIGWQALRLVVGVLRAALGPGNSLAGSLRRVLKNAADWANDKEGQQRLRRFFQDCVDRTKDIVKWLGRVADWVIDHWADIQKVGDSFLHVADAAYRIFKWLSKAAVEFGKLGGFRKIAEAVPGLGTLVKALPHAAGGIVTQAHVGLVGEAGPEAILPLKAGVFDALGGAIARAIPSMSPRPMALAGAGLARGTATSILEPHLHYHGVQGADDQHARAVSRSDLNRLVGGWG